jgi:redox-sensing transcriptional repressor
MIRKRKIRNTKKIYKSNNFFNRMFLYRKLLENMKESGKLYVKSDEFGELLNVTPALVRQDFVVLGNHGTAGKGSSINSLLEQINLLLKKSIQLNYLFIGNNELSTAILKNLTTFHKEPVHCYLTKKLKISEFKKKRKSSQNLDGIEIINNYDNLIFHDYNDLFNLDSSTEFDVALISSNYDDTIKIYEHLCNFKIKGIFNYSPYTLSPTKDIYIENVDFEDNVTYIIDYLEYNK